MHRRKIEFLHIRRGYVEYLDFTKDMVVFLDENNIDWVFWCNWNRNIKFRGKCITPDVLNLPYIDPTCITVSGENYSAFEIEGNLKGIGNVTLIISDGIHERRYYVTNCLKLIAIGILELYMKRWILRQYTGSLSEELWHLSKEALQYKGALLSHDYR